MSKVKKSWITFISLFAAVFLLLGLVFALPEKASVSASTYSPSAIFSAGTGGTVDASEKIGEGDAAKAYVRLSLTNGGIVNYRRDLALKWYAEDKTEGAESTSTVNQHYFSMDLSFPEVKFEEFKISFESGEENISKDGKSTNAIVFKKGDNFDTDKKLRVWVRNASYEEPKDGETEEIATSAEVVWDQDVHIEINEEDCSIGEFNVMCGNDAASLQTAGTMTNIGGYFMEDRRSSSSTPNVPMAFTTKLPDNAESGAKQLVLMKSLNGQSFELDENNKVKDTAPAVLVLNEKIYAFRLGRKFSLSYEAIDVLKDSVTVTREYYMLKEKDADTPIGPNLNALEGEGKESADSYNYKKLDTSTYFMPSKENPDQSESVSIRFQLDDGTDENDTYVYLNWYADAAAVETKSCNYYEDVEKVEDEETKKVTQLSSGKKDFEFIKVDRKQSGPEYLGLTADSTGKTNTGADSADFVKAKDEFKKALDEAASNTSAGSGAYIYLPSLRGLIGSKSADYRNLKFSVYYYKPSQSADSSATSQTSLKYNALKLEVTEMGVYKMRVIAQDASNNNMKYYLDGELVDVTSSNVWDIEGIPEFTFEIGYTGPTIEEVKEKDLGYRNDTYEFDEFEVIALSGYQKEYTLYRFDASKLKEGQSVPTYSDFVKNAEKYSTENYKDCLVEIGEYQDDVSAEDEAKWTRTDNAYYWNPDSSLSFIPQEACFYVLKLTVKDAHLPGVTESAYQVIEVRNPIDTIPAESQWLQENVVSVVLFAISGVLAIVVVVLFFVKPSDKKVEEIDLEKLKGKKKKEQKK